ncbi:MAG TPA: TonB-dependent siderophore receptor, partial [Candidatus Kapabacteria bacterium]|nr:TonB-dependent siderophore receptor [Candidatus Kapabacteria bacterium]
QETIGAPRTQANLNLEWAVPGLSSQAEQGLTLTGQILHTGAQFADTGNQQKVPDWTRLDLGARHTTPLADDQRLILHARLENVAGKDYWASSGGYPGEGYLTLGGPRTLLVSATLEF